MTRETLLITERKKPRLSLGVFLGLLALVLPASIALAQDYTVRNTDFDGDGLGDIISWDSTSASFLVRNSSDGGFSNISLGNRGAQGVVYDFDGNGRAELAAFDSASATWSLDTETVVFGAPGSEAIPGRYDDSGCTNLATYQRATGAWLIRSCDGSTSREFLLGGPNQIPVPEDYDCDGLTDPAVFNRLTSQWTVLDSSTGNERSFFYGLPGDTPLGFRFSRSDCADVAVYRQAGNFLLISNGNQNGQLLEVASIFQWGLTGDKLALLDVDGDGLNDINIYRSSDNSSYLNTSSSGLFFLVPSEALFPDRFFEPLPSVLSDSIRIRGDYDRDGRSEVTFASVNRTARQTSFRTNSLENQRFTDSILPAQSDALVPADYDGDGRRDFAGVFVEADASLTWTVRFGDGAVEQTSYGQNGDQPLAGDYDCDGRADKVIVRQEGFFKIWRFRLANGQEPGEVLFGVDGDRLHVADVTGDGCDDLLISRVANGGIDWWYLDIREGEPRYIQWGLAGDERLTPADVNGDGRDDFLVSRVGPGGRSIYALLGPGVSTVYNFLDTQGLLMTGRFSGVGHAEFASLNPESGILMILRGHVVYDFKTVSIAGDLLVKPDASVVSLSGGDSGGGDDSGGNPGGGAENVDCDVVRDFFDGGGGDLWKPISESTGNPVILLPAEYWTNTESLQVFGADGSFLVDGTFRTCCPNDNRAHFDVPRRASDLAQNRPITVRFNLRDGTKECREVEDPRDRND